MLLIASTSLRFRMIYCTFYSTTLLVYFQIKICYVNIMMLKNDAILNYWAVYKVVQCCWANFQRRTFARNGAFYILSYYKILILLNTFSTLWIFSFLFPSINSCSLSLVFVSHHCLSLFCTWSRPGIREILSRTRIFCVGKDPERISSVF